MSKIKNIEGRPILDSRGDWTIEVSMSLQDGVIAKAAVPQGKSKGSSEAIFLPPQKAIQKIKSLSKIFHGFDVFNQEKIDQTLIKLDGTRSKSKLGGNTTLGISLAAAKAAAKSKNVYLWKYFRDLSGLSVISNSRPRLLANLVNGGLHAGNNLDFQEYLVIPKSQNFSSAIEKIVKIYNRLRDSLNEKFGPGATSVGDEGGFAPDFKNNSEPFEMISLVLKNLKLSAEVNLGLDAAASNIKKISSDDLFGIYLNFINDFNFLFLEDLFNENDFKNFAKFKAEAKKNLWIVGDDLTTTNVSLIEKAETAKAINAIVIKPNQIGTVTETLEAVKKSRNYDWKIIVSHRSGETNDDFIADLAVGVGADGLKLGAPARGERIAKYNRLLEIENEK